MLRRVARVLRVALTCLGLVVLLWLPLSYGYALGMEFPRGNRFVGVRIADGAAALGAVGAGVENSHAKVHDIRIDLTNTNGWRPYFASEKFANVHLVVVSIPLWLLAFICLAWPVTSFIVARRRGKGRGFEVEAKPGAAVPTTDS